jgi:hypothetical protein
MRCWIPLLLASLTLASSQVIITGKIESCSGCALNRLPELNSFLKDWDAEEYQGVEVVYIPGRKAVLTIYNDEREQEQITLSDYATKAEMHALMVEKGFVKKGEEEIVEMKRRNVEQKQEEERVRREMQAAENQRRLDQMIPQAGGEGENLAVEKALDWKKKQQEFLAKKMNEEL